MYQGFPDERAERYLIEDVPAKSYNEKTMPKKECNTMLDKQHLLFSS
jgi:hypothetical protein